MDDVRYLTVDEVIELHRLVMERMGEPAYPLLRPTLLESAIERPRWAAHYEGATLLDQAVRLAVGISQAQAFEQGNKRAAFAATNAFLLANGVEVVGDSLDFADWLSKVAECDRRDRDELERQFADWLSENVEPTGATIPFQRGGAQAFANEPNLDLESMISPMTDSQNFTGKAYTIREGESRVEWLRRGSGETGEAREKFKATIYHLVRMALRDRVLRGQTGLDWPTAETLSGAYEEVMVWAVAISRVAGLDDWAAELVPDAVQRAYKIVSWGPDVVALHNDHFTALVGLGGSDMEVALERMQARLLNDASYRQVVADASAETDQWVLDAIMATKVARDNPHGDDDEAIARAILAKVRREREGRDPFTFVVDA